MRTDLEPLASTAGIGGLSLDRLFLLRRPAWDRGSDAHGDAARVVSAVGELASGPAGCLGFGVPADAVVGRDRGEDASERLGSWCRACEATKHPVVCAQHG